MLKLHSSVELLYINKSACGRDFGKKSVTMLVHCSVFLAHDRIHVERAISYQTIVTRVDQSKTVVVRLTLACNFSSKNSDRFPLSGGVKQGRGGETSYTLLFSFMRQYFEKRYELRPNLALITNVCFSWKSNMALFILPVLVLRVSIYSTYHFNIVFSSFHELIQSRDVRRLSVRPSVCKLWRKSLLLAGKWPDRHQTCTRWTPGQHASRMCSRSRSRSKVT